MIAKPEREQIIALIKREVVPAIGCTEPIAVALCVAKATETLGCRPEHIKVLLSANILKNAMGVGIPGTDMIGLPIAVALGALIGKSEYELEVLAELEHNGSRYLALVPAGSGNDDEEEDLEVSILKSVEENGEEFLEAIEDDAELEEVYSALMDLIYEEDDAPEA